MSTVVHCPHDEDVINLRRLGILVPETMSKNALDSLAEYVLQAGDSGPVGGLSPGERLAKILEHQTIIGKKVLDVLSKKRGIARYLIAKSEAQILAAHRGKYPIAVCVAWERGRAMVVDYDLLRVLPQ